MPAVALEDDGTVCDVPVLEVFHRRYRAARHRIRPENLVGRFPAVAAEVVGAGNKPAGDVNTRPERAV